jgi:hypothetical protein
MSKSSWKTPTLTIHGDVAAVTADGHKKPGTADDSELGENTASFRA